MEFWVLEKERSYLEERKKKGFTDLQFETARERRRRICSTEEEMEPFFAAHLRRADKAAASGEKYLLVVDQESDPDKKFSWDERAKEAALRTEKFRERVSQRKNLKDRFDKLSSKQRTQLYWSHHQDQTNAGIRKGAVAAISVTAVNDVTAKHLFVMRMRPLIDNQYKGVPRLPARFIELITHPAVVLTNVSIFDDITNIMNSFTDEIIEGVQYLESEIFFREAWGREWRGFDLQGVEMWANPGLLEIVEKDQPGYTFYKNPRVCDIA